MDLRTVGRIELSDDPSFTRKSWVAERVGWIALTAFLVAGFLGLLGPGLFSEVSAGEVPGLRLTYDRFGHYHCESTLVLSLEREAAAGGAASVWIEDRYLENVEIESIRPDPVVVRSESGGSVYTFAAGNGAGPVQVRFDFTYRKAGALRGRIGRAADRTLEIRQFIYP